MSTPEETSPPTDQDTGPARKRRPTGKHGPARQRGAQSGNRNAYKHGFYTRAFQPSDQLEISAPGKDRLQDEINLLRVLIANTAQIIQPDQSPSFQETISALYTVSLALARLDSLHHTNNRLQSPNTYDQFWMRLYKSLGLTDAEAQSFIDEREGRPPAVPIPPERWAEIYKRHNFTDEDIQAYSLPPLGQTAQKPRGGQAGNTNALKHGFYTSLFNSAERRRLEKFDRREIDDDILLLRVLIKRAAAFLLRPPQDTLLTFAQHLTAVRVITYAFARLEKLQRTKLLLRGSGEDTIQKAVNQALDELRQEQGWPV
jgi:hypothetical protein